jgi:hypothetical protein
MVYKTGNGAKLVPPVCTLLKRNQNEIGCGFNVGPHNSNNSVLRKQEAAFIVIWLGESLPS